MYFFEIVLYHSRQKKNGLQWNFQDKVLKIISYIRESVQCSLWSCELKNIYFISYENCITNLRN